MKFIYIKYKNLFINYFLCGIDSIKKRRRIFLMKNEKSSFQERDDLLDFNRIKVETDKIILHTPP